MSYRARNLFVAIGLAVLAALFVGFYVTNYKRSVEHSNQNVSVFVAARDICEGHVLAMQKGRTGHKYIISSGFQTMDDIMGIMERITGKKRPRRLPASVMAAIAPMTQLVQSALFPSRPQRLTPGAIRILRLERRADTSKARRELGFVPTPHEDAVREAYEFFVARGEINVEHRNKAIA